MSARMTIKNDSLKIRIKEDIPKVCSDDWHVWTSHKWGLHQFHSNVPHVRRF